MKDLTQRFGDSRNFCGFNDRFDEVQHREGFQLGAKEEQIEMGYLE
jgi:hypothetical protein